MKPSPINYPLMVMILLLSVFAKAEGYHISGKISRPDGKALEASSVSFHLEVLSNDSTCVVYKEQIDNLDMTNSQGRFSLVLGSGTVLYPANGVLEKVMSNSLTLPCSGSGSYTPGSKDQRMLRISFHDGTGWQIFTAQKLRAVPFATESENALSASMLGNYSASSILRVDGGSVPALTPTQATGLMTVLTDHTQYLKSESDPTVAVWAKPGGIPTCAAGEKLTFNGTSLICANDEVGSSVSLPTGTAGYVLRHDGTQWRSALMAITDVANLNAELNNKLSKSSIPACSAAHKAHYTSVTDTWTCENIMLNLTGDVQGNTSGTMVSRIKGIPISSNTPTAGQSLVYTGSEWTPTTVAAGTGSVTSITAGAGLNGGTITTAGTLSLSSTGVTAGTYGSANQLPTFTIDALGRITDASHVTVNFISGVNSATSYITITNGSTAPVINANVGTTAGTLAAGNDTRFSDARMPTGIAGGDLSGNYPNPVVNKLQGKLVDVSSGVYDKGTLRFDGATNSWKHGPPCEAGWTMIHIGDSFCVKQHSPSATNFAVSMNSCLDNGGNLCRLEQAVALCRSNFLTTDTTLWIGQLDGNSSAHVIQCTANDNTWSAGTFSFGTTNDGVRSILPYCCKNPR